MKNKLVKIALELSIMMVSGFCYFINKIKGRNKTNNTGILIIASQHLGETVMFMDAYRTLCTYYREKGCHVNFIGNYESTQILKRYSEINETEYVSSDSCLLLDDNERSIRQFLRILKKLKKMNFYKVIVPFRTWTANMLAASILADSKILVCPAKKNTHKINHIKSQLLKYIYDDIVWCGYNDHIMEQYKKLMISLGIKDYKSRIGIIKANNSQIVKDFQNYNCCSVIVGGQETAKRWDRDKFVEIISRIHNFDEKIKIILIGTKNEGCIGEYIKSKRAYVYNLVGKTSLEEVIGILGVSRLVVGNDTGSMHLAAALEIPSVVICASNNYGQYFPYKVDISTASLVATIYSNIHTECRGCKANTIVNINRFIWKNKECERRVRNGETYLCIDSIIVEDVWCVISKLIDKVFVR